MMNVTPTAPINSSASADNPVVAAKGATANPLIPSDRPPVGRAANAPMPNVDVMMPKEALLNVFIFLAAYS